MTHPVLPKSALRRDRWCTALNAPRRNPEPRTAPRGRNSGLVAPGSSGRRGRGRERQGIEEDDAVLGREGEGIDGGAVIHQLLGLAGQVSVRATERDLLGRRADVDQGDPVLEVPPVHVRGGASGAV